MAFTTEFVMGAGGSVEEIPVSMNGGGGSNSNPTAYQLVTVDAGSGAIVLVAGNMNPTSTASSSRPHLQIGTRTHDDPSTYLTGPTGLMIGVRATGIVQVAVVSRSPVGTTTFTGTVYVARL